MMHLPRVRTHDAHTSRDECGASAGMLPAACRAPNEALSQLGSTPLLAFVPGSGWGDMLAVKSGSHVGFAEGGCMPKLEQLLQSGECPAGVYSATLALLVRRRIENGCNGNVGSVVSIVKCWLCL